MQTANKIASTKLSRNNGQRFVRTAKMLLLQRRLSEATDLLRRGLIVNPGHREARLLLAKSLVAEKRLIEAWAELEKLINDEPDLAVSTLLVRVCLAVGDPHAALDFADQFMEVHGETADLLDLATRAEEQIELLPLDDTTEREEERDTLRISPKVQSGLILSMSGVELRPIPSSSVEIDPEDIPTERTVPADLVDLEDLSTERILPTYLTVDPEDLPTEQVPERSELVVAMEDLPTERTGASQDVQLALEDLSTNRRLVRPSHLITGEHTVHDGVEFEQIPVTAGLEAAVRRFSRKQTKSAPPRQVPHLRLVPPPIPQDATPGAVKPPPVPSKSKRTYGATAIIRPPRRAEKVIPLTRRKPAKVSPARAPRPVAKRSPASRWLALLLVTALTLAAAAAVGYRGLKLKAAQQKMGEARKLAATYDVDALRAALLKVRAAANKGGRTVEVVALAAAIHGELNYEFGESDVSGVEALVNEAERLGARQDPKAAADLALARAYLALARKPLSEAMIVIFDTMEARPKRPLFKLLYGEALAADGEPTMARTKLAELSSGPRVLLARARVLNRLGLHIEAAALLEYATMAGLPSHHSKLETVLLEVRRGAGGEGTLQRLRGLLGDQRLSARQRAWALLAKTELHQQMEQETKAIVTLGRVLKMRRPAADADFRYRMSRVLMAHKDYSRALAEIKAACFYSPQPRYVAHLDLVKKAWAKSHAAISELSLEAKTNPRSEKVRRALSKILRKITHICKDLAAPLPGCPRF